MFRSVLSRESSLQWWNRYQACLRDQNWVFELTGDGIWLFVFLKSGIFALRIFLKIPLDSLNTN